MQLTTSESATWPEDIIQLLDDHHVVVLSDSVSARRAFGSTLMRRLNGLAESQVIDIDGESATDLPSFCRQLERQCHIRSRGPAPWWRDMQSVIQALRKAGAGVKRRYYIWHDAHAMLESDVELFCKLINALFGVAAECEHINLDPVVLHRVVFLGGSKLGAYAEDSHGQFSRWLEDEDGSPFWEVASVIERPPVITYFIDG